MNSAKDYSSFIIAVLIAMGLWFGPVQLPAEDWPQWRGANRDGKSAEVGLLKTWSAGGPALAWKAAGLGKGYGSVAVKGDRIYTTGDLPEANYLMCLRAGDGKMLWKTKLGRAGNYGPDGWEFAGPRATPTLDGDLVFAVDQWGELVCADAGDGNERWRKNYERDFGADQPPQWGFSESPLVDGAHVLMTPGGPKGAMVALDKNNGSLIWQSKEFTDAAHYSSIVTAEIGGVHQYVQLTAAHVVGIAPKNGAVLWKAARAGRIAVIPTPIVEGVFVYVTSGYGAGCHLFQVIASGGKFSAEQVYANKVMVNHHGGAVKVGPYVYGYSDGKGLTCQDFKTGAAVWEEKEKIKKGCLSIADGMIYFREEDSGALVLVEASPSGYKERGRFNQPDRAEEKAWAHPTIANGKLYIRDQDLLLCYVVK